MLRGIHGDVEVYSMPLLQTLHVRPIAVACIFAVVVTNHMFSDGVRAGAKRLGRKKEFSEAQLAMVMEHRNSPRLQVPTPTIMITRNIILLPGMIRPISRRRNLTSFRTLPSIWSC